MSPTISTSIGSSLKLQPKPKECRWYIIGCTIVSNNNRATARVKASYRHNPKMKTEE